MGGYLAKPWGFRKAEVPSHSNAMLVLAQMNNKESRRELAEITENPLDASHAVGKSLKYNARARGFLHFLLWPI